MYAQTNIKTTTTTCSTIRTRPTTLEHRKADHQEDHHHHHRQHHHHQHHQQHQQQRHKTPAHNARSVCRNMAMIVLSVVLSSGLAVANCDQLLPVAVAPPQIAAPTLGVTHVQTRNARSAIYANENGDYSARASHKDANNRTPFGYLAAYGLRGAFKPQRFYAGIGTPPSLIRTGMVAPVAAANVNDLASLDLMSGPREDICNEHCICERRSNFISINCDFQKNRNLRPVFDETFRLPEKATSITIKLAGSTDFRLMRGFFANNTIVNSVSIEGTYTRGEQVEISTEAFRDNRGPYPEIILLNVYTVAVRKKAFTASEVKFKVQNSYNVIIDQNAFEKAKINGQFIGIKDLRISEKAIKSADAILRIESSHIPNIYRFEASIHEIHFSNCTIGNIHTGTFDVMKVNFMKFENCRIDVIKAKAITEKLESHHVSITGATIGIIEGEAIYGSGIGELILIKNKIDTIQENAIHVTAVNVTIKQNNIKHLQNNWLRVKQWSAIVVEKNQFGEFGQMVVEEGKDSRVCRFDGNSLTQPLPGSLNITNPHCILREISVNLPCRCNLDWLQELSAHDLRSETYCTIDDKLGHCFNASTFNTLKYLHEVCDETKTTLDCVANMNLKKIDGRFFTPEELQRREQRIPKLIIIAAGSIFLIALFIALIVGIRYCSRPGKHGSDSSATVIPNHLHTFSQEEQHIIAQTLRLIQKKYAHIHKPINELTQRLLQPHQTDKRCVKLISQIVHQLNRAENTDDDFTAFNQVLTQHLQPQAPTAPPPDPIYTEPGLAGIDGGFYTSSTIVAMPMDGYEGVVGGVHRSPSDVSTANNAPEHIYAEPNCAQQPLLRNEYASPADRNLETMDLYTEPISERDARLMPAITPPYLPQYATPLRNQQQKLPPPPSATLRGAHNLPDVLRPSQNSSGGGGGGGGGSGVGVPPKPLTNVQRIAQDLQNMPKFQLAPPTAQRVRNLHLVTPPLYTAPDISRKTQAARLASPEIEECELDLRGATALAPDSGSDHSGGSDETVKIDDVIEYADA